MNTENLFMLATSRHLRFQFKGTITTEDLWDLSLTDLDALYRQLKAEEAKVNSQDSLLEMKSAAESSDLHLSILVVKAVFMQKKEAAEQRTLVKAKEDQKRKILMLIEQKKDAALSEKSVEELTAMLENM